MRRGIIAVIVATGLLVGACGAAADQSNDGRQNDGWQNDGQAGGSGSDTGFVAGDGSVVVLDVADRVTAPAISGTTLDGTPWSLGAEVGHVVVLNVWASWCAPCRAEAPALESSWRRLRAKDVTFMGLNTRDSAVAAKAYVDRFGVSYPSLSDADGTIQLAFRDSLPPQAIPSTIVIDRQGRVAARFLGVVDETTLTSVVTDISQEP